MSVKEVIRAISSCWSWLRGDNLIECGMWYLEVDACSWLAQYLDVADELLHDTQIAGSGLSEADPTASSPFIVSWRMVGLIFVERTIGACLMFISAERNMHVPCKRISPYKKLQSFLHWAISEIYIWCVDFFIQCTLIVPYSRDRSNSLSLPSYWNGFSPPILNRSWYDLDDVSSGSSSSLKPILWPSMIPKFHSHDIFRTMMDVTSTSMCLIPVVFRLVPCVLLL